MPASDFDDAELRRACGIAGVMYNPTSDVDPDDVYLQVVRPGIVQVPLNSVFEVIGRFGKLTVLMPEPSSLCASKLVRGGPVDVEDIVWWIDRRRTDIDAVTASIAAIAPAAERENAIENLVLVRIASGRNV